MTILDYLRSLRLTLNHPFNKDHKLTTIWRILYWKINQWTFRFPMIVSLDDHIKCICYPDSSYGGMIVYNTWAEYGVMAGIKQHLKPSSIYFDIGANIGDTSTIAASYTKSKIFAFEPSPVAYPRLCENIALNNLNGQILAEKIALSDHDGYTYFLDTKTSETSHIAGSKSKDAIKQKCLMLDSYSSTKKIRKIDLVKIDVEGAELLVLKGASKLLQSQSIKRLMIELNPACSKYGFTNKQTINYLTSFGYKISTIPSNVNNVICNIHAYV